MLAHVLDSLLNSGKLDADGWPPNTRLLKTASGMLRVRDTGGSGPVALMVPDGPNVIEHHNTVIDALAPHARVVCFEMPGFGFSRPTLRYGHRLEQGAKTVLHVMNALGLREASLLFSCANGLYAVAAARLAPQRIRHLLLCQTPSLQAMQAWTLRAVPRPVRTPVVGQLLMRATRRRVANTWYKIALADKSMRPQFQSTADHALAHGACFCLAGVVQGLAQARDRDVAGVKTPTTLLWGDADRSHARTRPDSLLDLLPQATLQRFSECGHFPDLEQPQRYAKLALAALNA